MPNWKSPDSTSRLLAAVIASVGKIDCRKIATYYGEGATYDSIEGRLRTLKKLATTLREEVESGERPAAPPRGGFKGSVCEDEGVKKERKTASTAKVTKTGKGNGVLSGRVSKANMSAKGKGAGKEKMNGKREGHVKIEGETNDSSIEPGTEPEIHHSIDDSGDNGGGTWQEGNAAVGFETLAFGGFGAVGFEDGAYGGESVFEEGVEV